MKKLISFVASTAVAVSLFACASFADNIVNDVVDGAEDVVDGVVDGAEDVVDDGDGSGTINDDENTIGDSGDIGVSDEIDEEDITGDQAGGNNNATDNPPTGISFAESAALGFAAACAAGVAYITRKRAR